MCNMLYYVATCTDGVRILKGDITALTTARAIIDACGGELADIVTAPPRARPRANLHCPVRALPRAAASLCECGCATVAVCTEWLAFGSEGTSLSVVQSGAVGTLWGTVSTP